MQITVCCVTGFLDGVILIEGEADTFGEVVTFLEGSGEIGELFGVAEIEGVCFVETFLPPKR